MTRRTKKEENRFFLFFNEIHAQSLTIGQEEVNFRHWEVVCGLFFFYLVLCSKNASVLKINSFVFLENIRCNKYTSSLYSCFSNEKSSTSAPRFFSCLHVTYSIYCCINRRKKNHFLCYKWPISMPAIVNCLSQDI